MTKTLENKIQKTITLDAQWKQFQRQCEYREPISFGHYRCQHSDAKMKGCPYSRWTNCPAFKEDDKGQELLLE